MPRIATTRSPDATSVAYDCWAFRRLGVKLDAVTGAITRWLYRDPDRAVERMARGEGFPLTGREVILTPPLSEEVIRALKVGDVVLLRGEVFTGRDQVHAYLMKNPPPVDLRSPIRVPLCDTARPSAARHDPAPTAEQRAQCFGAILAAMDGIGVNRELAHPLGFVLCLALMVPAWWLWNRFMDR